MLGKVSVIIVNYNTGHLLYNCLESISRYVNLDYEVIVADNHSVDTSVSECGKFWDDSNFRLIELDENFGFAKANNIAAGQATGRIIHFLNPDTELAPGITQDYLQALLHPEFVYVNPLVNRNGSLENDRMPIPVLRNIRLWNAGSAEAQYWYKGASVIISADNFHRIGGWCEDYFMYAEDLDLFYAINKKGIEIREASAPIFHYGGGSSSKKWSAVERETLVQRSTRLFYRKNSNMFQYYAVKLYYLLHYLFKNPRRIPSDIRAWIRSFGKGE